MSKQLTLSSDMARSLGDIWASGFRRRVFVLIVLAGIVIGLYGNSLRNHFVNWDDPGLILSNQQIRSLKWENIKDIFSLRRASTYQPIRVLSYAVDYHFWELNPLGYHITNTALYLFTCMIIFLVTSKLLEFLRAEKSPQSNVRVAFFTAALFAVHPVHVEAVTWLSARKEVLLGFFLFSSLYFYLKATTASRKATSAGLYGLAFLSFVLATFSKPVAVILPGIILLFEFSRGKLTLARCFKNAIWFIPAVLFSLSAIYVLLKVMVEAGGIYPYLDGGFLSNFFIAFYLFILNIKLMALTFNYSPVYIVSLPNPNVGVWTFLCLFLNIALMVLAALTFRKNKVVFFAVFWFYMTILPFSNIIPISTLLADRYVFIPSFAFCIVLALGLERFWSIERKDLSQDFFPSLTIALLIFLLAGYSYMTVSQNRIWRNSLTLWSDALAKDPRNNTAMNSLGVVYLDAGENEKALELFQAALEVNPSDPIVHNNLGIVFERMEDYPRSEYHLLKALALKPGHYEARVNLGILFATQGDFDRAIGLFVGVLAEYPQDSRLHHRLGHVYEMAGKFDEAIHEYEKSMELTPHIVTPYESLARLYLEKLEDREKALYFLRKGIEVAPNSKGAKQLATMMDRLQSN